MITFSHKETSLVSQDFIKEMFENHVSYISHLEKISQDDSYNFDESSLFCPRDKEAILQVKDLGKKYKTKNLKYIFVIGIGGSNLGTKAIYDALQLDTLGRSIEQPEIIFIDTVDSDYMNSVCQFVKNNISSSQDFVINVISKSGGTTETLANAEYFISYCTNILGDISSRVICTTDYESPFWKSAKKNGYNTLSIPKKVGGRFSVLSAVGLFPLYLAGVNIDLLVEGAQRAINFSTKTSIEENYSFISAIILFEQFHRGNSIHDSFFFNPCLESLGKWYRQLMGESIGKECDLSGERVEVGITPTVSIGSTDLHSVGQLYIGGIKNKVTTFVFSKSVKNDMIVNEDLQFSLLEDILPGKSFQEIMNAILQGTKIAYSKKNIPFMEIAFSEINEKTVGEFLQFKMCEIMYLGKLFNINAFDQPHVENYKKETRSILLGNK